MKSVLPDLSPNINENSIQISGLQEYIHSCYKFSTINYLEKKKDSEELASLKNTTSSKLLQAKE